MQLKVSCYQLKIDCYIYKMFYVSLVVATHIQRIQQKPLVVTQKIKIKELKHTTTKNKSQRKTIREEERNKITKKVIK